MKLVIFDLAGTLMPSSAPIARLKASEYFGISIEMDDLRNTTLEKLGQIIRNHGIDQNLYFDRFWEEYKKEAKQEVLFPETIKVLRYLKDKKVKMAIFSDNRKDVVYEILRKNKIESFFDIIITLDDVKNPKPDPDGLNQILKNYTIEKEDILFVGDRIADKTAGDRLGINVLLLEKSSDLLNLLNK